MTNAMREKQWVARGEALGLTLVPRPYPISKARLSFPVYWSLKGRQVWAPLRFEQSGLFYGERENLDRFLTRICAFPQREGQFFEVIYASYAALQEVPRRRYFTALTLKADLSSVVEELIALRDHIAEGTQMGREPNRKVSLFFLDLGPKELAQLSQPVLRDRLALLLKDSARYRLHFFLTCQDARMVPEELLHLLDWKAYLGESNYDFAESFHEDLTLEPYNVNRDLVGMVVDSALRLRLPVHDLAFEHSGFKKATDLVAKVEEDAYRRLLDSL